MTPFVGILLSFAVALLLGQVRTLLVISVVNAQLAVLLLMVMGLFVLATLRMRRRWCRRRCSPSTWRRWWRWGGTGSASW